MAAAPAPETGRAPGWREVLIVAAAVVGAVLGLALLTSLLPTTLQEVVFRTPLAIGVLLVGTVALLARLARRDRG
jgi:predicted tellurium resistance membrane protein TerC